MDTNDLALVRAIHELHSLSAAADQLGMAPPLATKRLAAIEARLGQRLFLRTTRRVSPTAEGEIVYAHATRLLAGFQALEDELAERQTDLSNENRRAQVRETIGRRKLEEEFNRYLQELRGEAYVVFRSGDRAGSEGSAPATPPPPSGG